MVSPSYDGLAPAQRRQILAKNPYLFANAILSADVTGDRYSPDELAVKNRRTVERLLATGAFAPPSGRAHFVYRLEGYGHTQTGLVGLLPLDLHRAGRLRAHEGTEAKRQELLQLHLQRVGVQSSPIGMFHRSLPEVEAVLRETTTTQPILSFSDIHDVRQTIWKVCDAEAMRRLNDALAGENLYLTDGHHRLGAALAHNDAERKQRREETAASGGSAAASAAASAQNSAATSAQRSPQTSAREASQTSEGISGCSGDLMPSDFILAVLFSQEEIRAMGFHRIVRLPDGWGHERLAERLRALGELLPTRGAGDSLESGRFGVFLGGRWHRFVPEKAPKGLDVTWLQEVVLQGVLGMDAGEIGKRVEFLPGRPPMPHQTGDAATEPLKVLEGRCKEHGGVGFALHPVPLAALKRLCDAGELMPPKSTFFHPKPRSGVFMRFLRHPPDGVGLDPEDLKISEST